MDSDTSRLALCINYIFLKPLDVSIELKVFKMRITGITQMTHQNKFDN